jgi:hypothetical protein
MKSYRDRARRASRIVAPAIVNLLVLVLAPSAARAVDGSPLFDTDVLDALASEISGEHAQQNLERISASHRMRASRGFRAAAEHIAARLREGGVEEVEILQFPADGKTLFGTQKSRPAWDVEAAELWELVSTADGFAPARRIGHWDSIPLSLAQDSDSAEVTTELIDAGAGTSPGDYVGKEVAGKLVLVSSQPEAVQALAVDRYGAAGIISYAQNQRTAWWGEDENLIRWGHLDSFSPTKTFAFMVSLKEARAFKRRLADGERIVLRARIEASRHAGTYDIVSARIAGSDPALATQEIAFSCHLDHPHPGANDNASGCATILEVARTFAKLLHEGRLERPRRPLRFIWPPEIEGTTILLNARPDLAAGLAAVIHLDMVGGGPASKAVFHVSRSPASLPSFVNDVGEAITELVNRETLAHASGERARFPLISVEGGKEALLAVNSEFSGGSDHAVFTDSSFRIPTIYLHDWPDRYIHTNFDLPANIDPTKLKRAAFIGAASAWLLANLDAVDSEPLLALLERHALVRTALMLERRALLEAGEAAALTRFHWAYESAIIDSIGRFVVLPESPRHVALERLDTLSRLYGGGAPSPAPHGTAATVYSRNATPRGPMSVFGYDYFLDHYGAERARRLRLLDFVGARGEGGDYALEALNFVDGRRSVQEIRDALAAELGPVPLEMVSEYLAALASIGVLTTQ